MTKSGAMLVLLFGLGHLAWAPVDAARAQAAATTAPPTLRLPEGARPLRYVATLTVVPGEDEVAGEVVVDVALAREHRVLWLNADALKVERGSVDTPATSVTLVGGHEQFLGLAFDPPLAAGVHQVTLAYRAEQSRNSARGVFTLREGDAWYAMTHFEPLSARRAFPCFDEPAFKVPWQLNLRVPKGLTALANTPVVSETDAGDGMKLVRFAASPPLPSYLVAFAVGPWESVDLGTIGARPTPTRIVVPRGRTAEAAFAGRAFPELFVVLERWFGSAHPYPKLDHIAIPLTVGFAMENVGLVTYGAPTLLAKPGAATPRFRRASANVGAHEIAHQWFGNLVTPAWWDDLWLNEAFATWIADKAVAAWQPDYERGAGRVVERAEAISEDMLTSARRIREPITDRGDIYNAFDAITYQKGATVLDMFEGWIGAEPFRQGVRQHLEARRDGNATVDDFLAALGAASGRPVGPAMSTFLDQNGAPELGVALRCDAGKAFLDLTQARLAGVGAATRPAARWQIPVCVRYGGAGTTHEACTLLVDATARLPLKGGCPAFVVANAGGRGYYVPDYRGDLLARLAQHRRSLTAPELASLLYDLRASVRAGRVTGAEALAWARATAGSGDRHVVLASIELATFVRDTLVAPADAERFAAFVRSAYGPRARALGFVPRSGESDDDQLLRRSLLRFAGPDDPQLRAQARSLTLAWLGDRKAVDPGLVDTVLLVAGRGGDAALFAAMLAEARTTTDRLERRHLQVALLAFADPVLADRALALLLDPDFDIRESATALYISRSLTPPRRATHDFIVANFDALASRVSRDAPGGWPGHADGLCSARDRADVEAFWQSRIDRYAGGTRTLAQTLEAIDLCARLRTAQARGVGAALARY